MFNNKKAIMQLKDWISFFVGLVVLALGFLPLAEELGWFSIGVGSLFKANWFLAIVPYLVAIFGFYLAINSIREITNSNQLGWMSFGIAAVVFTIGILPVLKLFFTGLPDFFKLEFLSPIVYQIIFIVEGIFLMIATFAMEL